MMTPAGDPKQSAFVNQFRKSWNGIIDEELLEGGIWEESGLGIWGKHLGDIWEPRPNVCTGAAYFIGSA